MQFAIVATTVYEKQARYVICKHLILLHHFC